MLWRLGRLSVITGMVAALGLLPLLGVSGLALKAGADGFTSLPADFTLPRVPEASTLYASDGETVIATFGDQYRINSDSEDIAEVLKQAIVAAEDARFYEHNGVDSKGIVRALVSNFSSGEVTEGASTITMQYVRQVLVYTAESPDEAEAAIETSPDRKLREMRYALAVEQAMTKDEILTVYLNTVYFGHGAYGVGSAARVYFGKNADELDLNEAATLAGLVQSPSEYDPISGDAEAAKDRRDYVLDRMVDVGTIDAAEAAEVAATPLPLHPGTLPGDSGADGSEYGFFADYFESWWSRQEQFGSTVQERLALLNGGGYHIVSSLDVGLQKAAEDAIAAQQPKDSPYALGSVVVEPGTGQVKVMAVNRNYSADTEDNGDGNYPNTTNPLLSGGSDFHGYQAGSTFKMFTMLAALEAGMNLDTAIYSPHRYTSQYFGGGGTSSCGVYWCPSNDNTSMTGTHNMWTAFGRSVNTYFVQLEERVGADKAVEMAERLGLEWTTDVDRTQAAAAVDWGSFTLGVASVTPLQMAAAYAALAADGEYAEPTPIAELRDFNGADVTPEPRTEQVLEPDVARAAVDAARCTTGYGAASGACAGGTAGQVAGIVGGPVAGKTGTTDGDSTAWFTGFTPNLAVASFMADPDDPGNLLQPWMTSMPTNVSAQVLAAGWRADPSGEFTPPQELVGNGFNTGIGQPPGDGDEPGDGPGDDTTDPGDTGDDEDPTEPVEPGGPDDPGNPGGPPGDLPGLFGRRQTGLEAVSYSSNHIKELSAGQPDAPGVADAAGSVLRSSARRDFF
ncbi:membrane peptidoglycan carboxypeptidase [Stackebrandtia albiflava]|uniref:Membrane peptidoglycan carboxypeptidase n=1 Tax=Stackebrandtia albiflava TaxID=406432 RepID=A0A562V2M6_9ACTN|nr:transglycosylase domain-containing protein [Stackebrandtia albiflava]TWJ12067.1 membrane peptidoglycan carboxypeptidase [Stackebrandtia albiflava]